MFCFHSILEKPRTLQNKSVFQIKTQTGKPAIIEIEVESLTKPYVSWATNPGGKLGVWTASSDIFPNYVLKSTIVPKLKSHFGKYGIKVRNAAGSIDLDIELKLKGNYLKKIINILTIILKYLNVLFYVF